MKEIPVGTEGLVALVDDEDYPLLSRFSWLPSDGPGNGTTYCVMSYPLRRGGKRDYITIPMHRLIIPARRGWEVDHRDTNGLNNQKSNLRECTRSQNIANTRTINRPKSSRFKGVHFHKGKGKWIARIKVNQKAVFYRGFDDETEAARAYDAKARAVFGEFARLNFPAEGEAAAAR